MASGKGSNFKILPRFCLECLKTPENFSQDNWHSHQIPPEYNYSTGLHRRILLK
jgi:hypothetical protein